MGIDKLTIRGFKSIRALEDFKLTNLNVLIGANGSGKSNFVSFFSLLRSIVEQGMQKTVEKQGGAGAHLFMGPEITEEIVGKVYFGLNGYEFTLQPTVRDRLVFGEEVAYFEGVEYGPTRRTLGSGHTESKLESRKNDMTSERTRDVPAYVYGAVSSWVVYHFHDTSETAAVRRSGSTRDYEELRPDAGNLAAFILRMRKHDEEAYDLIRDTICLVAPFFDDFKLRPERKRSRDSRVSLEWTQKGSNYPFQPWQLSDGTLRFICLAAALLQPEPPATILFDEPELGLHPYALSVLAGLLKQAASRIQVIVSTQSAPLLNEFEPEDVIVVDRRKGASEFRRLKAENLAEWLREYSVGEIWQKNLIDGGPVHE